MGTQVALCADVGSTFTKVAAVDLDSGTLLASAAHRTTVDTDVLHGLDAALAVATANLPAGAEVSSVDACSSAGGGLRLAVVGYEALVTAQAGHRVGLSAGARVVHLSAGRLDAAAEAALRADRPDVVLLVGGTDGGDAAVLRHNAARLAAARIRAGRARVPIVVAGNRDVRDEVCAVLAAAGAPVVPSENVLPRIGELNPHPARAAIREVFLRHVIGGKRLSRGPRFAGLVRGATPEVVLTAVELLADHFDGDLVVVDVGGATTDVYSVLSPDPDPDAVVPREVAGTLWRSRTVEGDLGMRWSAPSVVSAASTERLLAAGEAAALAGAAQLRAQHPGWLPQSEADHDDEARLALLAATIALRRHARADRARLGGSPTDQLPSRGTLATAGSPGRDLRRVRLVIGSGGVLRHAEPAVARAVLSSVLADHAGGWSPPREAATVVDHSYVLAPAGLLAAKHPRTALQLLQRHLVASGTGLTSR